MKAGGRSCGGRPASTFFGLLFAGLVATTPEAFAATCSASWYGAEQHGRTASGAPWRPYGISVAHRSLPFGTLLEIRLAGRSITAPVLDRGPFVRGRCLDLSAGAARALGMRGTAIVSYEIVGDRSLGRAGRRAHRVAQVTPDAPPDSLLGLLFGRSP